MTRFLLISLVSFCLGPASAVAEQAGLPDIQAQLEQAKQRLDLTDEQLEQLRPILKASIEESIAVLQKHDIDLSVPKEQRERPSFREMRALGKDMKQVRESTTDKLAGVLSEEQLETYIKIQEERRKQMRDQIRAGKQ